MIGRQGDTVISADLLRGKLPTSLPSDLLPETLHVLQSLATPASTTDISPIITDEEFVQTYRVAQENTSSSPSGRHIGHYKAACRDPSLVSLHSQMMSIPF
jgi:hypothetical protein